MTTLRETNLTLGGIREGEVSDPRPTFGLEELAHAGASSQVSAALRWICYAALTDPWRGRAFGDRKWERAEEEL